MSTVEQIAHDVLQLPTAERAHLAARLLESLDRPGEAVSEEEAERAWSEVIKSRSDAVHSGEAELIEWQEAKRLLRESLDSPRAD